MDAVKMQFGDEMTEDISPAAAAESALQSLLLQPAALNASFSIISEAGPAPSQVWLCQWHRIVQSWECKVSGLLGIQ